MPLPDWWSELDGSRPVVHVTQGTLANTDYKQLIAPTLRARAQSLRVQLLAEEEAAANTASEKLTAPVALLSIAFLLLFLYPALARLMAS